MERHPPRPYEPPKLEQLGAYRILRELGSGGMGTVYEAQDQILGRRVALKVMKTGMPDELDAKKRFLREAQSAAAVTHDHIVTIYQVGEDRGTPFLAMQLLDGESLEHRLDRGERFRVEEIIRIGTQIADGLAAAHQRGMIHRDIKPANIWLEAPKARVKILDFGLARGNDTATHLTQSGVVMGTPAYMSPEQANGEQLDARTDIFSLGCILYELCTGTRPFDGPSFMAIISKLAAYDPPPVKQANPAIPTSLSNLIGELLIKNRDHRPADTAAIAERLERLDLTEAAPTFFNTPSIPATANPFSPTTPTLNSRPVNPALPSLPPQGPRPVGPGMPSMPSLPTQGPRPANQVMPSLPVFTSFNVPPTAHEIPGGAVPQSNEYPAVNPTPAMPPTNKGGGFVKALFLVLLLGGLGYWIMVETLDRGKLVIKTNDPDSYIAITQDGKPRESSIIKREFDLRPGKYQLELLSGRGHLDRKEVTIERGKTETVNVVE